MNYWLAKHGYDKANYLAHHGILGQKWGVRRYQNPDGSLTDAGKKRYLTSNGEFNYARRNAEGKKGAAIYGNYMKSAMAQARQDVENVANMPTKTKEQRAIKEEKEKEILTGWDDNNRNAKDYGDKLLRGVAVQKMISEKSFDWYNNEPKSTSAKSLWDRKSATNDELSSIALKDIGFEDTKENRRLIEPYWKID